MTQATQISKNTSTSQLYTHQSVPQIDSFQLSDRSVLLLVDPQNDFMNGSLAVPEGVVAKPKMISLLTLFSFASLPLIRTFDVHLAGSPTFASSFDGINPYTLLFRAEVLSWTEKNNPILPHARFTLNQFKEYFSGGHEAEFLWPDHTIPFTTGFQYPEDLERVIQRYQGPRYDMCKGDIQMIKNSVGKVLSGPWPSKIQGFVPEAYSAAGNVLGEKTGLVDFLRGQKIEDVVVIGVAGDYCPGRTASDLAREGFNVLVVVDAQGSVKAPLPDGTTSENAMIADQLLAGVKHITTQALIDSNRHLISN